LNARILQTDSPDGVLQFVQNENLNEVNIATVYHRLATFVREKRVNAQELRRDHRFVKLETLLLERTPHFREQSISLVLWAHAVLNVKPMDSVMQKLEARILSTPEGFNPQGLSLLVWAYASLGHDPGEKVWTVLDEALCRKLVHFRPQNISNTLWAWATLGHTPGPHLHLPLEDIRAAVRASSEGNNRRRENQSEAQAPTTEKDPSTIHVMEAMALLMRPTLKNFTPQAMTNSLWALAVLEYHPGFTFLRTFEWNMLKKMESFSAQNLANFMWACGSLGYRPNPRLLHAVAADVLKKLPHFTSQGLTNVLWSFAVIRRSGGDVNACISPQWIDRVSAEVHSSLTLFSMQGLANLYWAYATLGHVPSSPFLAALDAEVLTRITHDTTGIAEPQVKPQALGSILWAAAVLNHPPSEALLAVIEQHSLDCLHHCGMQVLCNMLWALTLLEKFDSRLMAALWRKIGAELDRGEAVTKEGMHQIYQCWLLQPAERAAAVEAALGPELLAACHDLWCQVALRPVMSQFHLDVARALNELGVEHEIEKRSAGGLFSLDIALTREDHVCIQVDGPHHFATNTLAPLGMTVVRDRLLRRYGWRVISVPYHDWYGRAEFSGQVTHRQREWLRQLLKDHGVAWSRVERGGYDARELAAFKGEIAQLDEGGASFLPSTAAISPPRDGGTSRG